MKAGEMDKDIADDNKDVKATDAEARRSVVTRYDGVVTVSWSWMMLGLIQAKPATAAEAAAVLTTLCVRFRPVPKDGQTGLQDDRLSGIYNMLQINEYDDDSDDDGMHINEWLS